jgi:hypothetical protein
MTLKEETAELFLELSRLPGEDACRVMLRFDRSDEFTTPQAVSGKARFDLAALPDPQALPQAYGQALTAALFADPQLSTEYAVHLATVEKDGLALRVRLTIDPSAADLHALKWETLQRPGGAGPLASDENVPLSRFLYSSDRSPVEPRPRQDLRALLVVSGPPELDRPGGYTINTHGEQQGKKVVPAGNRLARVDVAGELARAEHGLGGAAGIATLESRKAGDGRPSLANIRRELKEGRDILLLVCHGALLATDMSRPDSPRKPVLILEDDQGRLQRVDGQDLADAIHNTPAAQRPRLVVLVSCQSAGDGHPARSQDRGALAALGPLLVEAGVLAVVAMQGNVSMTSMAKFVPAFFRELLKDGQVDRAVAAARQEIMQEDDWWMPVLYMRLKGGRLWYQTGIHASVSEQNFWHSILGAISSKRCTPVLGSGLLDSLLGSPRQIARDWAEKTGFPLAPHEQEQLPQVMQYVSTKPDAVAPVDELVRYLVSQVRLRHAARLPVDLLQADLNDMDAKEQAALLDQLISAAGRQHRQADPLDPHRILARLPVKVYISTTPDRLLEDALEEEWPDKPRKEPVSLYFCWNARLREKNRLLANEIHALSPTVKKPLVYHLFGRFTEPASLVLAEDDYFDFLMWINNPSNTVLLPQILDDEWVQNSMLFLGFQTSDWNFRMLFRSILNEQRRSLRLSAKAYDSLAVQLQPGDDHLQPERARKFLENSYTRQSFNLYWGSPAEFLKELNDHWSK